jgi:hypothetical protein
MSQESCATSVDGIEKDADALVLHVAEIKAAR